MRSVPALRFVAHDLGELRRRVAAWVRINPDDVVVEPRTPRVFRWAAAGTLYHGRAEAMTGPRGDYLAVDGWEP